REIAAAGFAVDSFAAESTLATLISAPAVALTGTIGPVAGPDLSLEGVDLEADLADLAGNGRGTATITARGLSGAAAVREAVVSADMTGLIAPAGTVTLDATGIAAGGATIARADLDARLTDVEGRTDVDARLSIPAVEAEGARIDGIALAAKVADALATPRLDVRLDVAEVAAEGLTITAPRLTAAGPLSALALGLDAAGEMGDQPLSATVRATANVEGEPSATVSTLTAALGEAEVALEQPLTIRTAGGTTRIDDLALSLPGGRLSGQAALPPGGLAGDLTLAMADLGELRRTVSEDIPVSRGTFDLTAAFDTRPGQARADITGTGRGIGFEEAVSDIGDLGLDLGTTWNGRVMQAEAALSGPFGDPIEVTAALPLRATDAIAPSLNQNGPLQASVDWVGRVGPLWALVPAPDHVLDGDLTIDLDIGGTVADPAIAGGLGMRDGQYQNLETGTILTDLTMDSALEGTDVIQLALRGNDGASGTLTVDVALDEEGLDARVQAANAVLVRRDDVTAAISTDITAVGPLSALALGGTTTIERAEIRLVNAIPPSVADLGEVRIKGAPVEEAEEGAGSSITLDLKVVAPDEVFVRGRGLQSEWQIDLAITGTAARPIVVGSVEKRRGTLDILGRFFNLDEGEVIFDGGREIDPRLNVVLSHENDGTTGFIRVSGTGSDPAVNFSSEPALPEDEVLPRVIFGRSSQSLSGIEALQLASAIATLLDGSGGFADQFRGAVGLDVLSVQTGDDGDTSVVVGRNVAEGVFVGAEQPIGGDGQSKVTVEIDVFENVIVDGELEGDGGTSLGVQWRKDF
ncbi:MAG: translocation/assembly module TamB domain-containing protein, partial [Pseudomonadota bacterium]